MFEYAKEMKDYLYIHRKAEDINAKERLLIKVYNYEQQTKNKIYLFSKDEMLEMFETLAKESSDSLGLYKTELKHYLESCRTKSLCKDISVIESIHKKDLEELIPDEVLRGRCITKPDLYKALNILINPVDKLALVLIFEGLYDNKLTTLRNLKWKDVDLNNKRVYDLIAIDKKLELIIRETKKQLYYHSSNGHIGKKLIAYKYRLPKYNINNYIFTKLNTRNRKVPLTEQIEFYDLQKRLLKDLREYMNYPHLKLENLKIAGTINRAIIKSNKELKHPFCYTDFLKFLYENKERCSKYTAFRLYVLTYSTDVDIESSNFTEPNKGLGTDGERIVEEYLNFKYRHTVVRNVSLDAKYGYDLELRDKNTVSGVEVKSTSNWSRDAITFYITYNELSKLNEMRERYNIVIVNFYNNKAVGLYIINNPLEKLELQEVIQQMLYVHKSKLLLSFYTKTFTINLNKEELENYKDEYFEEYKKYQNCEL